VQVKMQFTKRQIMKEGLPLHVTTAFISGFVSTVVSSPFDVVKSRVMGQPLNPDGSGKVGATRGQRVRTRAACVRVRVHCAKLSWRTRTHARALCDALACLT